MIRLVKWFIKTALTIALGIISCVIIFCCVGCDASPAAITASVDEERPIINSTPQYLNGFQQFEFECLISDFNALNDGGLIYWIWNNSEMSDTEVDERNAALADSGVIPIFVDVCRDGSLYVATSYEKAHEIAEELNALNTNSFSRAMFFIDSVATEIYGHPVTVYDSEKDVFQ